MDYDFFESLLHKYKNRGILVDANLLLLYFDVINFNHIRGYRWSRGKK